jgi:hypothetical protein
MVLALVGGGCGGSDDSEGYMDDQPPNGSCDTDGSDPDCLSTDGGTGSETSGATSGGTSAGSASTGGDADECKASTDCPDDQLCVADFEGDKRGPYQCVAACLENRDEAKWCADAAACCNAAAMCTDRGFFVGGGGDTGTTG